MAALRAQVHFRIFDSVASAGHFEPITRHNVGINDSCSIASVCKSIESNIKVPGPIHHSEKDIATVSCVFNFTILYNGPFARDSDTHEVSIVQRFRPQPNCIHIQYRRLCGITAL